MVGSAGIRKALSALASAGLLAVFGLALTGSASAQPLVRAPTCNGLPATIVGTGGPDVLKGTAGDDVIVGLGGDDTIKGLGGNDTICGNAGNDMVAAADGDDTVLGGSGLDQIFGGAGADDLFGGADRDMIHGKAGDDTLDGGPGNDVLRGNDGADTMLGGFGNDLLIGGDGANQMFGGDGNDTVRGGPDVDMAFGENGADELIGNGAADTLDGGSGNDILRGGALDDTLNGGDGADILRGNTGDDVLNGDSGDDEVYGSKGDDELNGGDGEDTARGGPGDDTITGGAGDDFLYGNGGIDAIDGGPEIDLCLSGEPSVNCEFPTGTIVVEKQTDPDGAAGAFSFTGDAVGTIADDGTISVVGLTPGTYTSTEDDPTVTPGGFDLTDITCDDADSSGAVGTRTATFNVAPGETVTCVFTNTQRGTIIVEKQTDPDGTPGNFTFTGDAAGTISDDGTIVVPDLVAGTYTSTESDPAPAFLLTGIACDDGNSSGDVGTRTAAFNVEPGETVTCTFTNKADNSVTIVKDANPDDVQDFSFTGSFGAFSLDDDGDGTLPNSITFSGLAPGPFTVTEADPTPGFDVTSITCDDGASATPSTGDTVTRTATINVDAGESVTCTFTNTKRGTIIVEKQTDPDGAPGTFTFTGDAAGSIPDDGTITVTDLMPGTYTSTEDDPTVTPGGFDLTDITCDDGNSSGDTVTRTATFVLDPGETVKCVFTNTQRGTIIVEKQTDPDLAAGSFTFTGDVAGSISDDGTLTETDLPPGTYTSMEADPTVTPGGFDLTDVTCDDTNSSGDTVTRTATFVLDPGETVKCVFTNTQRGTIIVEKQTDPDGAPGTFVFTGDAAGSISDDGTIVVNDLVPGTYTSTESDPAPAFDLTDITCDDSNSSGDTVSRTATFVLDPGETVTCVFTDTQRGTIIVEKQTDPDGAAGTFVFTGDAAGSISDDGTIVVNDLVPGTYTSTETDPAPAFGLTDITCDDSNSSGDTVSRTATFVLDPGETVTCVFTDTQRGTIIIEKSTIPAAGTGFGFTDDIEAPFGFTLDDGQSKTFTNVVPSTYSVTETTIPATWSLASATCDDASPVTAIVLDPGETVTCTFNNVQGGTIIIEKSTLPAGGTGFSFTQNMDGSGPFSLDDGQSKTFTAVAAGTYAVAETPAAGWALSTATCDDASPVSAINLSNGETVTCTFNNVNTPPVGAPDTYQTIGNTEFRVDVAPTAGIPTVQVDSTGGTTPAADGVLDNDTDPEGGTLTVSGVDTTAAQTSGTPTLGTVLMNPDGSFTYFPPAGLTGSSDFFDYLLSDGVNPAVPVQVEIQMLDLVAYVDNSVAGPGTGVSSDPFSTLPPLPMPNVGTVYVFRGTGTDTGLNGGIGLQPGQRLVGSSLPLQVNQALNGNPAPVQLLPLDALGGPKLSDGVAPVVVDANSDTFIGGLDIDLGNNGTGIRLNGLPAGGAPPVQVELVELQLQSVSPISVQMNNSNEQLWMLDVTITDIGGATNGKFLDVQGGTGGVDIDGGSFTSVVPVQPRFTFGGSHNTGTVDCDALTTINTPGNPIVFNGADGTYDFDLCIINAAVLEMLNSNGVFTFGANTTVTNAGGAAFSVDTMGATGSSTFKGTINNSADRVIRVANTAGGSSVIFNTDINDTAGTGIEIDDADGDVTINDADLDGTDGILIQNGTSGTITINTTMVDVSGIAFRVDDNAAAVDGTINLNEVNITNPGGRSVQIEGMSGGSVIFDAASVVTDNGGEGILINANSGGTVTFNGAVTLDNLGGNNAVALTSNTGATINFTGGLDIDTTSGDGFSATGGGTVNVDSATVSTTIDTTTGTAVDITSTTIGGTGVTFDTVNKTGGPNGIKLTGTGTGAFTVSGGSIAGATNKGVDLTLIGGPVIIATDISGAGGTSRTVEVTNSGANPVNSIQFTGLITENGSGVWLDNNDQGGAGGAIITFSGGLGINVGSTETGFEATGGGTIEVCADDNCETAGGTAVSNTVSSLNGTAVNLDDVTIGVGDINWNTINKTGTGGTTPGVAAINTTNAGTFNGGTVDIDGTGGTADGISIVSSSAAFNFDSATIDSTGDAGIHLNGANGTVTFTTVDIDGTTGAGIDIGTNTNSVNIGSGTIGTTTGNAVDVNAGSGNVTVGATITNGTGKAVEVTGRTSGTVAFNGAVTDTTAAGINLGTNAAAVAFNNAVDITNSTGAGVTLAGNTGGTFTFADLDITNTTSNQIGIQTTGTNTGATLNSTTGTISTGSAKGVDLDNIALGVNLVSLDTSGATNGIDLDTTTGSFTVEGDGASEPTVATKGRTQDKLGGGVDTDITLGSGGSILNSTTAGVKLNSAAGVTLRNMVIQDSGQAVNDGSDGIDIVGSSGLTIDNTLITGHNGNHGIDGSAVAGFTMVNSEVHSNATSTGVSGPDVHNVRFDNLTGTSSVTNTLLHTSDENIFSILNSSGTLNLVVDNTEIRDTNASSPGNVGMLVDLTSTAVANVRVEGSDFQRNRARGFQFLSNSGTTSGQVTVKDSTFEDSFVPIDIAHQANSTLLVDVDNNTINQNATNCCGGESTAINIILGGASPAGSVMDVTIRDNTVGNPATTGSGSFVGVGTLLHAQGAGTITARASGNTIRAIDIDSGFVVLNNSGSATANITFDAAEGTNVFNVNPETFGLYGMSLETGALAGDSGITRVNWAAPSTVVGETTFGTAGIQLLHISGAVTTEIQGYAGANNMAALIAAYADSKNTSSSTPADVFIFSGTMTGTVSSAGGVVPLPTLPSLP